MSMIDQVVAGRYSVVSQIGSGGMGVVFQAHDSKLRRDVALKVIAPHLVEDEEARARFLIEAQALAGLSHPNIVTVFDLAEDPESGMVFIVMELLTGRPLRKRITDPNRPGFYDMAIQVCRALEHAHGKGVLHRDIKPENIFVCTDGTVKLMDFGLARLLDGATVNSSGMVTGTVAYMSPEQLRGGVLDPRADLYGLGVLFYEYLCGFTPFASDSTGTTLLKHLTEPPPSIRTRVASVSPELDALIQVLLAKEPADRYPSAMILRDSLERIRARGSTTAAPIVAPRTAGPPMPATVIPLVAPKPQRPPPKTTTVRTVYQPRPEVGRFVAVFCVILLGAILAFAFGETLQRMFVQTPDPPKKAVVAKKRAGRRAKSATATHGRRSRRLKRASRSTPVESATGPAPTVTVGPKAPPEDAQGKPVDKPVEETVPDDHSDAPAPDPGPHNKGDEESNS